jgi:GTP-binding protein
MSQPKPTRTKPSVKPARPITPRPAKRPANTQSVIESLPQEERDALAWSHSARFFTTAAQLNQLPVTELPEVAYVGRSNAGKSTAINTMAQQRQLAYASKTPGRTQHINLFLVGPKQAADQVWTDLPGYGYAAVERTAKLRWQEVMASYLALRRSLCAMVHMVDSRHGFTELDRQLLAFVAPRVRNGEVKLLVLLTKADKLNRKEQAESLRGAQAVLDEIRTDEADMTIMLFSSLNKQGVGEAAQTIRQWAATPEQAQAIAEAQALARSLPPPSDDGVDDASEP